MAEALDDGGDAAEAFAASAYLGENCVELVGDAALLACGLSCGAADAEWTYQTTASVKSTPGLGAGVRARSTATISSSPATLVRNRLSSCRIDRTRSVSDRGAELSCN